MNCDLSLLRGLPYILKYSSYTPYLHNPVTLFIPNLTSFRALIATNSDSVIKFHHELSDDATARAKPSDNAALIAANEQLLYLRW